MLPLFSRSILPRCYDPRFTIFYFYASAMIILIRHDAFIRASALMLFAADDAALRALRVAGERDAMSGAQRAIL